MTIPNMIKIGAIVVAGIILAFISGYVIFSYFTNNGDDEKKNPAGVITIEESPTIDDISDSEGISPAPSVAGISDNSDSEGISHVSPATTPKGGNVLGETSTSSSNDYQGITPTNDPVRRITLNQTEKDTSNSQVYLYKYPEVKEHSDYYEYVYTFELNSDARERYKDGFKYSIKGESCDDDDYFTSDKYDFQGTISSDDIEKKIEIKVRINKEYIDDENDFDSSEYKLDGKNYVVRGDIKVPVCD